MDAIETFRFVSIIDEFFEESLGRYTIDGIECVPFLRELGVFYTSADKLLDEVEGWSAPYFSCEPRMWSHKMRIQKNSQRFRFTEEDS